MPTIKVSYSGELRTEATHLKSAEKIITDAPPDNNGRGEAFSPTDLVSGALCSCMMTIMGIIAEREGVDLTGLKADVTKIMKSDPRRIGEIQVRFYWDSPVSDQKILAKLKHGALTCPVALSISEDIKQDVRFNF